MKALNLIKKNLYIEFKQQPYTTFLKSILPKFISFFVRNILKFLGIEIYSEIIYPFTDYKFKVEFHESYWKELQKGLIELNSLKYLIKNVKKNQVILDVGAWIGTYTLLLSKLVGEKGKIIAFEPNSINFKTLVKNIQLNKLQNVKLEKVGLSNNKNKSKFYLYGGGGDSRSSLINHEEKKESLTKTKMIRLSTIDGYCQDNNIIPDGIKIDVEGAEALVIGGAQKIIYKYHPWVILEFHNHLMTNKEKNKLWNKLFNDARSIIFLDQNDDLCGYYYGKLLKELPKCRTFTVLVNY